MLNRLGIFGSFLCVMFATAAIAQTSTQQTATHLDSGIVCATAANPQVATQNTLTFTVPAGQRLYLTNVYIQVVADGTGGTALAIGRFTTTNLQAIEWDVSFAGTASTASNPIVISGPAGFLTSAVGPVSATIVSPTGGTHNAYAMTACGYYAQ
jgi:hypothetical protein